MAAKTSLWGSLWIAIAATLWATDTLFRLPTLQQMSPLWIVLIEHLIGTSAILAILLVRKTKFMSMTPFQWVALALVGGGGSALATVFFTQSFRYINPSVTILLQKLQPVIVILLARVFLREKPSPSFYPWALIAFLAGVVVSFPDLDFSFLSSGLNVHSTGVLLALSAAGIWAVSTVVGKSLLNGVTPQAATFWRYFFGAATLAVMVGSSSLTLDTSILMQGETIRALLYMGLVPGLLAVSLYYEGLKRVPASTATLVELVFPVSAVFLNTYWLGLPLNPVQLVAGGFLLVAVTKISKTF